MMFFKRGASILLISFTVSILLSCKKNSETLTEPIYYMEANVNGVKWRVTGTDASYGINHLNTEFPVQTSIVGYDSEYVKNASYQSFSFSLGFVPTTGRYYFNNKGSQAMEKGVSAVITKFQGNITEIKYSDSGYIEITSVDSKNIKGNFEFTAKNAFDADTTTLKITEGKFSVINVGR